MYVSVCVTCLCSGKVARQYLVEEVECARAAPCYLAESFYRAVLCVIGGCCLSW